MMPFIQLGTLKIPSFFVVISFSLSLLLFFLSARVEKQNKSRRIAFDLALLMMFSGFLGGRLMHVFYEEWAFYRENPLFILYFWNGGFVFLGGVLACLLSGFIYSRLKKVNFWEWADFLAPCFSLAHALGRIGCVLSGCCFGHPCQLPWALDGRHPTAIYLIVGELLIFILLLMMEKKQVYQFSGGLFVKWLLLHSLLRFNVEYFRDDFRGLFVQLPLLGSLSVSQLISLVLILGCLVFYAKHCLRMRRL